MKDFFIHQRQNREVVIGGVRMLAEFMTEIVTVSVSGATIVVEGKNLEIGYFNVNEICICGTIESVHTNKTMHTRRGAK